LSEYNDIKEWIKMSILEDIETEISTIITPQNMWYLKNFYEELYDMKVSRWRLLNFIPTGNGKNMDMKYIMDNKHLHKLLNITNWLKSWKWPYISYGLWFGPNFYWKSIYNFITQQKIKDWMIAKYPCPTINNSFLWILVKNKEIYRCFKLISNQEAKIWEIGDNGKIILHKNLKFEDKTLKDKLRWMCSRESCDFQDLCLWWCRSNAYILAKIRGEKNPEYAGQEMCITNLIQNQRKWW
jgi:radical SAM protein with 4Fe4S-binding SPASM domain